ncbi:hypothetical protein VIBRN418_01648 [Vibrio sp. N418]|uniref:head-tail connector protein n=1 Tax=Vibrio sp. (strain N418) TaxID=701176 RepID=UPI00021C076E|nr:head-tail connector protein [Vibrio sp. N418]EGU31486.1 hypothetical protein VIBRN418_01648 [Vibrio sp. N418]
MFDYKTIETLTDKIVTVEEAKNQCRVYDDYDLLYLESLIEAATEVTEKYLNRNILTSTVQIETDRPLMKLPRGLATGVNEFSYEKSIIDDGTRYVLDPTYWNFNEITGSVNVTKDGKDFLSTESPFRYRLEFTTGWSSEEVPQAIKHAILMLVSSLYENRESAAVGSGITVANIPVNHAFLLDKYKVHRIG